MLIVSALSLANERKVLVHDQWIEIARKPT